MRRGSDPDDLVVEDRNRPMTPSELERRLAQARIKRAEALARRSDAPESKDQPRSADAATSGAVRPQQTASMPEAGTSSAPPLAATAAVAEVPRLPTPPRHSWYSVPEGGTAAPVDAPDRAKRCSRLPMALIFLVALALGVVAGALEPLRSHVVAALGVETFAEVQAASLAAVDRLVALVREAF